MKSPCVGICKLDVQQKYCVGCGRTMEQIRNHYLKDAVNYGSKKP